jgi:hypothetical protein
MPALDSGLVSRRPFGHDPFLLRQHNLLTTANGHVDRLLGEVKMYGEVLNQIGNENNRLREANERLIEENKRLKKDNSPLRNRLGSVVFLRSVLRVMTDGLPGLARITARKLRDSWRVWKL